MRPSDRSDPATPLRSRAFRHRPTEKRRTRTSMRDCRQAFVGCDYASYSQLCALGSPRFRLVPCSSLPSLASVQGLLALGQGQPGDSVEDFTGESVSLGGLGVLGVGLDFEQKVTKQTKELRKSQPVSAIRWGTDAILRSVGNTSTGSILEPREARIATKIAIHVLFLVLPS